MSQNPSPGAGPTVEVDKTLEINNIAEKIDHAATSLAQHIGQAWSQDLADALLINGAIGPDAERKLQQPIQGMLNDVKQKLTSFSPGGNVVADIIKGFTHPWNEVMTNVHSASEAVKATSSTAQWQGQAGQSYAEQRTKQLDTLDKLTQITKAQVELTEGIAQSNAAILTTILDMVHEADAEVAGQLGGPPAFITFRRTVASWFIVVSLERSLQQQVHQLRTVQSMVNDAQLVGLGQQGTSEIGEHWPSVQG